MVQAPSPDPSTGRHHILDGGERIRATALGKTIYLQVDDLQFELRSVEVTDDSRSLTKTILGKLGLRRARITLKAETADGTKLVLSDDAFNQATFIDSIDYDEAEAHVFYWIDILDKSRAMSARLNIP